MRDVKITTFAKKHGACESGVTWALKNCPTGKMSEAWDKLLEHSTDSSVNDYLWWVAVKVLDDKTLRLLSVRLVRETPLADGRRVVDLLTDQRSLDTLIAAERFAIGEIGQDELEAAWGAADAARSAAWNAADAAWNAARSAAWGAARSAAWNAADAAWNAADAAWNAAWNAARSAAWGAADAARSAADAARSAAWGAARSAAWNAARSAQARIIAEIGNPWRTK